MEIPKPGSRWRHRNGNMYVVLLITNEHSQNDVDYPVMVVYQGSNGFTSGPVGRPTGTGR